MGLEVTGLDISPKAKIYSPNLNINILDVENTIRWPYPDNSFDIVYNIVKNIRSNIKKTQIL